MFLYSILTIKNLGMSKHEGKFNFKYLRKYQNYDKNIQLYNFGFGDDHLTDHLNFTHSSYLH